MNITCFTTLMTMRDYIIRNTFCSSLVKNKVFTNKFIFKFLLLYLTHIVDNPSFELKDILESLVFIIRTSLFASDTSSTIHHQIFILFVHFQIFLNNRQRISKSINIRSYSIFKMSDFTFVVITHVYQDGIRILDQRVKTFGVHMDSLIRNIKGVIV